MRRLTFKERAEQIADELVAKRAAPKKRKNATRSAKQLAAHKKSLRGVARMFHAEREQ